MKKLQIPVGISDFTKIREQGYYYVDKTGLISELLEDIAEVTLITRPRRFGKTMGMSMLANFFDIRKDSKTLFEGLEISRNTALCETWQNKWPVLFVTFKDIDGLTFASAKEMLIERGHRHLRRFGHCGHCPGHRGHRPGRCLRYVRHLFV